MRGSKGPRLVVLQPRDRQLLTALDRMRVVDREHAKVVAGFCSTTRANTRLLALTRAGLLTRMAVGTVRGGHKFLYSLTPRAARLLDVPYRGALRAGTVLAGNLFLEHQLRLNEVYLQCVLRSVPQGVAIRSWKTFSRPLSSRVPLMPDAYVELATRHGVQPMFVEVDLGTESLGRWRTKVQAYLQLATSGAFATLFGQPQFRVLVLLPSDRRLLTVRRTVSQCTSKIFWFATFESTQGDGLWSACWSRPTGEERRSLL